MTASRHRRTDPAKRTEAAVRMRQSGWTLRKIAGFLGVTHTTVRRDLARWEQENVDLPALLEVSPGRFVHQGALTRPDLKNAIVQAETKASNAKGYAEKVRRLAAAAENIGPGRDHPGRGRTAASRPPGEPGMTAARDLIIPGSLRTEVRETSYVTVRCGRCAAEFDTHLEFATARCKNCGRVCRLGQPCEGGPNVVPLRREGRHPAA